MTKDQYYLKCDYSQGIFEGEYSINFKPYEKGLGQKWRAVKKEDVLVVDSEKNMGLAKIVLLSVRGDKALIEINDARFYVKKRDVLKNCSPADYFRNNPVAPEIFKSPLARLHAEKLLSKHIIR